jgi:hypothetical protein
VNVYPFIEAEKAQQRSVKRACELLEVSRAAYYAHRADVPSARQLVDDELTEHIRQVHQASKGRYGAPRIHAELRRSGHRNARKRVARLMRTAGLCGRRPRRWRRTTIPDPAAAARADLIRRDFSVNAAAVNTRWCGDITYIPTWEGWLYLATVIDIASRRVVGFALAEHLRTELVADALTNAVAARDPAPEVVFHTDRGCQGGFSWSSQHLVDGGVDGDDARAAAGGAAVSGADPIAGSADGGLAAGSRPVLGGDCAGCQFRGRGAGDRRVVRGRGTVVPARWRCEPLSCPDGVGAVSVLRRTRGHRHLARPEAGGARDLPATAPVAVDDLAGVAAQRVHADLAAGVSGVDRAVARRTPRSSAQASEAGRQ